MTGEEWCGFCFWMIIHRQKSGDSLSAFTNWRSPISSIFFKTLDMQTIRGSILTKTPKNSLLFLKIFPRRETEQHSCNYCKLHFIKTTWDLAINAEVAYHSFLCDPETSFSRWKYCKIFYKSLKNWVNCTGMWKTPSLRFLFQPRIIPIFSMNESGKNFQRLT